MVIDRSDILFCRFRTKRRNRCVRSRSEGIYTLLTELLTCFTEN